MIYILGIGFVVSNANLVEVPLSRDFGDRQVTSTFDGSYGESVCISPDLLAASLPISLQTLDRKLAAFDFVKSSPIVGRFAYCAMKRLIDVIGALIGLIVFGPFMLVGMLLVRMEDGGPVIFRQKRIGLNGQPFTMLKIRTMVQDAEKRFEEVAALNHHDDFRSFKAKDDPRILRIGKFLRKYSVDEFPQLFNVLIGDMSLVGPRPSLEREVALYDSEDCIRLTVKPGLTCYWQISGRGEIPFKEQVQLDRQYIRDCSTATDLLIVLKTFPTLLGASGGH